MSNLDGAEDKREKYVSSYDLDTKKVSQIPISKLKPTMVRAEIEGLHGVYWVDVRKIKLGGEKYHQSFSEEVREQIRQIMLMLKEVRPLSFKEWEDGFLRDRNAQREIAIWRHTADVYSRFTSKRPLSLKRKKAIFVVLSICMVSDKETLLQRLRPKGITKVEMKEIISAFYEDTV